jgi:hypothetical protein
VVGGFVELGELRLGGDSIPSELNFGVESDPSDSEFPFGPGFEVADGAVGY